LSVIGSATTCAETRGLFAAYVAESLSREERTGVRTHLVACPACRAAAASTDPALIFTVLATSQAPDVETVSAADTAKILAGVRAGIALKTAEKRLRPSSPDLSRGRLSWRRPAMTAAAAVAAVALAWTLGPRQPAATGARTGAPVVATSAAPASSANANASSLRPASLVPAAAGGALEPANIDRKSPADATIYDWNPGGGQPRVVWIVDRSLDI
jgi:hypothetical protein